MPIAFLSALTTSSTRRSLARSFSGLRALLLAGGILAGSAAQAQVQRALPAGTLAMGTIPADPAGQRPALTETLPVLRRELGLRPQDELRPLRTETDELGFTHVRYQQYFQGVKVEHGVVSVHARAGRLETWSGTVQHPAAGLSAQPALTADLARQRALEAVGASRYRWQSAAEEAALRQRTGNPQATYFPKGELVVVGDFRQPEAGRPLVLAWKFNIYAAQPVSRGWVYVDAATGKVVLRDDVIKHANAPATFATRYVGSRTSTTDSFGGGFRLRETVSGKGVTTLNCERGTDFSAAVDFVDNDNNWTAAEYDNFLFDNAALDAHIGAQATQQYWTTVHGRDSFDDKGSVLLSFVHFDSGFDNAFWDGDEMVYGDGSGLFRPLTAVDVCGHEIGHAVCETTANLVYRNESGAMNEGFSDIWGACVEHHLDPTKQIWLVGEDIALTSPSLRSMSDPKAEDQPDTYLGINWATGGFDNGGVHTNSGVLNYWFYLTSVGGAGTNDNGTAYNVTGITIQKAARIAYRAERIYLTGTSVYADGRQATLQAAVDLYGLGSPEVRTVAEAWRAVGLGDGQPTLTTMTPTSGPIGTLVTLTGTNLGTTFRVTFNGTSATAATVTSNSQITVTVPPGATTGQVVVTTTNGVANAGVFTVTGTGTAPSILSYTPPGGAPQGATVVITGTGFTGTTAVRFNGTTAAFTVNSATQITTTVPATATSGALTVTTPGGTATAPTPFLVLPAITALAPTSGPVGTSVTITGTSFTGALNVKFNGVYATYTVNSAASITAIVPVGATTGSVTVRTPSGTATSPAPFTVTPSIAVTSFSPPAGPVLTTIVTIYGVGFTGATQVKFNNTVATTYTVVTDTEIWATVPAGATTGPIQVTSPIGTASSTLSFNVVIPGAPSGITFTPAFGPVGQTVLISGIDLQGATRVAFNGTTATILTNTATQITTTVPVGATTGQISITTPIGTGVSAASFQVVVPPTNDLCTAANLPVLVCGTPVLGTTRGAGSTGDPTQGCGTTIDGAGVFYRVVGTGGSVTVSTCGAATDYDCKLHVFSGTCGSLNCLGGDDDGCGPAGGGSQVTFTSVAGTSYLVFVSGWNGAQGNFEVLATCTAPVVPVITAFSPAAGPIGTTVVINGSGFTGASAVKFNGTTATFNVNAATRITATVPAGATTGPISVTAGGGTGTSANPFTVTGAAPTLTTMTPTSGPVGTTVTVTGQNLGGTTGVLFGTLPATSFSVNPAGTQLQAVVPASAGYVQLRVTTAAGSALTSGFFCTQYTVTATPAARCGAGTVTLTASGAPTTGAAANRYAWYTTATGGTPIAGATGASFTTPSLTASTTYYVAVSPATACAGTRVAVRATVNAAPVVAIAANGPTTFCGGGSVVLTASGATSYLWSTGATTPSITVSAAGTYSVTGTGAGSCAAAPVSRTVTISAAPATPTATGSARCGAGTLTLTASGAPTGGTYRWYAAATGGTALTGTGASFTTPSLTTTTTYYVSARNATGCESATRQAVTATVNAQPTATVAASGPVSFCQGDSVILAASGGGSYLWSNGATTRTVMVRTTGTYSVTTTATGGCTATSTPVTVTVNARPATPTITQTPRASGIVVLTSSAATGNQWYLNGNPIPGATQATYAVTTGTQSGQYTVQVTGANTCTSALSAAQTVRVTGTAPDATAVSWQLWPNPAHGTVQCSGATPRAELVLYDATGRAVLTGRADATGAATLDVTSLPRGVYAVRLGGQVKRLVVE